MRGLVLVLVVSLYGIGSFAQQAEVVGMSEKEAIKMAGFPKLNLPKGYSLKSLPATKDNTTNIYFPNIFQQFGWSCNQASSVGYVFTYEMNAARDVSAASPTNQYPPSFVWNFLNNGDPEKGVSYFDSWEVIRTNGIPSLEVYGDVYSSLTWVSGYDKYYQGMKNRTSEVYSIEVGTPDGLNTLKHWLNDHMDGSPTGGVANFQIASGGWRIEQIPAGLPEEQRYITLNFGEVVGHALTFVGWNDSVRYDFNGDGLFTNDIDITDDGIVDMHDWEVGAMVAVNSWGAGWGDNGRVYIPYRLLAFDHHEGGIWANTVTVMRPKENYEPKLTIKASVTHTKRNQIKIVAGVSSNFAATKPDVILEYPFFNFLGGSLPMQGITVAGSETLEFGLDISPLLNYIDPKLPAKFFLEVYHKEGEELNGSGKIDYMSIMDYGGAEVVEEVSPETNVGIRLRDVVRMSVIYDPVSTPVGVSTTSIPDAEVGKGYSHILQAEGGTPPYKWSNMADEYVAELIDEQWQLPFAEKILGVSDTSRLVVDLGFDFSFYGKTYDQITVLKNGGVIMGPNPKDYPYVIDPSEYIFQNPGIFPFYADLQYLFSSDGVYRLDEEDGVTIAWDATMAKEGEVYDPKFGVKLCRDGRIETGYFTTAIRTDWNWIAGVSAGDTKNYTLPEINDDPIFYGGININYTMNNWPSWLFFSQGGALLGVAEDGPSRVFLPVKVSDNDGFFGKRTFNLQINGTSSSAGIQAQSSVEIYPNPFTDRISLKLENPKSEKLEFDLFSVDGKKVFTRELSTASRHIELDMSYLEGSGNFFYQIKDGGKIYQGKLLRVR